LPASLSTPLAGKSLASIQQAYGARATLTPRIEVEQNFALAFSYRGFAWYLEGMTKNSESALVDYRNGFPDLDRAIRLDPGYAPVRRHRRQYHYSGLSA